MKRYRVRVIEDAEHDLIDIYRYIACHDSVENAEYVLEQLESLCSRLTELPERGHAPPELDRIGVTNYREVNFKPYRVIYTVPAGYPASIAFLTSSSFAERKSDTLNAGIYL